MPHVLSPGDIPTAAQWNALGSFVIEDVDIGVAAADVTFSSIPQTASHLMIVARTRNDEAATGQVSLNMQLNGITTAVYKSERVRSFIGTVTGIEDASATQAIVGVLPRGSETTEFYSATWILLPHYTSSTRSTWLFASYSPSGASQQFQAGGGRTGSTAAAVTSIKIFPSSGNFEAGSRVTLYGMNG